MISSQQQPIQISLQANTISLTIPTILQKSFTITNITLRPVIIYPILSHEDELFLTISNRIKILQAFQQVELTLGLKSISVPVREIITPVLRVYFWEIKEFRDEDEMILEQDQELLKSPRKIMSRHQSDQQQSFDEKSLNFFNQQDDHERDNIMRGQQQMSEQMFGNLMKRNRVKQQILQKYRQKMFSLKNISAEFYQKHKTHKSIDHSSQATLNNKNNKIPPKKTHPSPEQQQALFQQSQSSQQQQVFSHLMYREFTINIQLSDQLRVCGSFGMQQVDEKQIYLLENVIRPGIVELSEAEKRQEVEFIQNFLFRECERLGKVKAIDRLSQDVGRSHKQESQSCNNNQNYEYSSSQRSIRKRSINSSRQVKVPSQGFSQSLTIKIPNPKLTLQRYAIQYKSSLHSFSPLSNKSLPQSSPQNIHHQSSCHFIQVITQKYFYLFKLTKILRYDFWYCDHHNHNQRMKRKMSELSSAQGIGKKREERKKWKLPSLIDLEQVRLEQSRLNANRFAIEINSDISIGLNANQRKQEQSEQILVENQSMQPDLKLLQWDIKMSQLNSQFPYCNAQRVQDLNELKDQKSQVENALSQHKVQPKNQVIEFIQPADDLNTEKFIETNNKVETIETSQLSLEAEKQLQSQNEQPHITKPQISIFQVPKYTRNAKSFSQLQQTSNKEDEEQKYHTSLLEFNRQGHNFTTQYTDPQMLEKLSEQQKSNTSHQKNQNDKQQDRIKETEEEQNDKIEELPQMIDSKSSSDKSDKQVQTKKKRPKFLFTSNDDLRKVQSENSYAKKKALLSQSFSHSFQSQFKLPHQQPKPEYIEQFIVYPDPILALQILTISPSFTQQTQNQAIISQQQYVFIFFRTHLLYFPITNPQHKITIKVDPLKVQDAVNYKTLMTAYKSEEIIVANGCYLYWIDLRAKSSQWKYVQRKEIYCVQVIEEMKLLAVGGKNFSKLSLFGKQTSRSNIKIYNCGKADRNHLFTYDIPINQPVGNVCEMKYITTPPSGGKLLATYTNYNDQIFRLIFFRIRAYNNLEVYGKIELNDVGIQSIISMKYNTRSQKLVVLEQVDPDHSALKKLKVKFMYEKAEVLTECVKMQLGNYESFEIGGEKQTQWYSLLSKGKSQAQIYRTYKFHNNPETLKSQKHQIEAVFDINEGNEVLVKGYDFIKIKRKKKANKEG